MAAADPPAALLDIASTLPQDEIPFKLRCAICNKLAVGAFRLPCCDQSICETCQASLSNTCSVCAHTPVSPDLCKPNKALRTTLKVFLRTEEKKREKERQSAITPTPAPVTDAPVQNEPSSTDLVPANQDGSAEVAPQVLDASKPEGEAETPSNTAPVDPPEGEAPISNQESGAEGNKSAPNDAESEPVDQSSEIAPAAAQGKDPSNEEGGAVPETGSLSVDESQQPNANMMNMGQVGFPGMGWNAMNPFMSNMFNANMPNQMGMPMSMAANHGMFGDYGMNMAGMGMGMDMGMGMNYNGQGMYGSSGWDGSWQNGQDNYNPNAFANGTGPHGGAFGGPNMAYASNSDYQSGYHGQGYGRGGFRGGRGGFQGRGGYGGFASGYSSHGTNQEVHAGVTPNGVDSNSNEAIVNGEGSHGNENGEEQSVSQEQTTETNSGEQATDDQEPVGQQLQGIPTIETLDQSMSNGASGWQGPGYGHSGFRGPVGRGGSQWGGPMPMNGAYQPPMPPKAPVVEGAPAAPRGMRQGLPNTSMLRQRAFQQGRPLTGNNTPSHVANSEPPQDHTQPGSPANPQPPTQQQSDSRSRSPSQSRASRAPSQSSNPADDDKARRHQVDSKRSTNMHESRPNGDRSSGSHEHDTNRTRRDEHRSRRFNTHRSRANSRSRSRSQSRSPARNGEARNAGRLATVTEGRQLNGHKASSEAGEPRDLAGRASSHRSSKERPSRREEDRDRERERESDKSRHSRRRDRDRERERDRRDRDRDSDRDRRRERDKDRDRERERERERDRDRAREHNRERNRGREPRARDRDRKRSRRDRSESANASDISSRPQPRRTKREEDTNRPQPRPSRQEKGQSREEKTKEAEKDPYTLAREAANRERVLREQQNRGVKSAPKSSRRDSRQDRLVGGRRLNFKYEDEI